MAWASPRRLEVQAQLLPTRRRQPGLESLEHAQLQTISPRLHFYRPSIGRSSLAVPPLDRGAAWRAKRGPANAWNLLRPEGRGRRRMGVSAVADCIVFIFFELRPEGAGNPWQLSRS
jgi:hypothetical protein